MLLNQLSISYRCHSSIGNSLDLVSMIEQTIKTFIEETDAVSGSFYLKEKIRNKSNLIFSHGKEIALDVNELFSKSNKKKIVIVNHTKTANLVLYSLENALIIFIYDKSVNLDFIVSMFESFREKLNISINSCLNVQELKEKNSELKDLNNSLTQKIEEAIIKSKEREKQFFEQLKMAQMGELIGNIAHQWRQPLSVISTASSGMKLKKETNTLSDEDFYYYCDNITNSATYLSNTIDEFRDYIKESHKEKLVVIQERVRMAFKLVENSYKHENIEIIEDFCESEPIQFRLILGELLQVIIALLNNAREALSSKKDQKKWVKYSVLKDSYNITIVIEDNAGGIDKSIIDKIFNPYFTTKHQNQGTGIGLYSSYDIVVNHLGGNLDVENSQDGAKFYIKLPLFADYSI